MKKEGFGGQEIDLSEITRKKAGGDKSLHPPSQQPWNDNRVIKACPFII